MILIFPVRHKSFEYTGKGVNGSNSVKFEVARIKGLLEKKYVRFKGPS